MAPKLSLRFGEKADRKSLEKLGSVYEDEADAHPKMTSGSSKKKKKKNKKKKAAASSSLETSNALWASTGSSKASKRPTTRTEPTDTTPPGKLFDFADQENRQTQLPSIREDLTRFYRDFETLFSSNKVLTARYTPSIFETTQPNPEMFAVRSPGGNTSGPGQKRSVPFVELTALGQTLKSFQTNVLELGTDGGMQIITKTDAIFALQNLLRLWMTFDGAVENAHISAEDGGLVFNECDMGTPAKILDHYRWCLGSTVERLHREIEDGRKMAESYPHATETGEGSRKGKECRPETTPNPAQPNAMDIDQWSQPFVTAAMLTNRQQQNEPRLLLNRDCDDMVSVFLIDKVIRSAAVPLGAAHQRMAVPVFENDSGESATPEDEPAVRDSEDEFARGPHKQYFKDLSKGVKDYLRQQKK